MLPHWLKNYDKANLKDDLTAGLTVGVMIIPQGMAYAMLAGLPPIYGLYASMIPMIVYAMTGTSRQLSVGPVALDSILVASGISAMALAGSEQYIALAILLALMVGFIQFTFGVFRLGFLINFLSGPVIKGFTAAAAIIIGMSQLKHLLGINLQSNQYLQDLFRELIANGFNIHLVTLIIGLGGIAMLLLFKKFAPKAPGPLILVVVATLITYFFQLNQYGVGIIGHVPGGLPVPDIPRIDFQHLKQLLPAAFAIALVSFMESNAVAKSIQAKHRTYRIIPNRELMALGLANMIGGLFKSFPVSGGLSRSAVNDQAGAKTGLASVFTAVLVMLTLLFLTPLFFYLPVAVLASIIIVTIVKFINVKEAVDLMRVDLKDFLMMLATFIGTLFLGIGPGIAIGVLLSLAWIIFEASYPHSAELGRIPGTKTFRNVKRFQELDVDEDVLIFRFDAPLFFANVDRFRNLLYDFKFHRKEKLKAIIVDMESINTIDSSALSVLDEIVDEIKKENILLLLAEVKGPVRDKFYRSGLTQKLGENCFFVTIDDAVEFVSGVKRDFIFPHAVQTKFDRT